MCRPDHWSIQLKAKISLAVIDLVSDNNRPSNKLARYCQPSTGRSLEVAVRLKELATDSKTQKAIGKTKVAT